MNQFGRLLAGAADDQGAFARLQGLGDFFQGEEAGGIEGGHIAWEGYLLGFDPRRWV